MEDGRNARNLLSFQNENNQFFSLTSDNLKSISKEYLIPRSMASW